VVVDALLNYCEFRHGCTSKIFSGKYFPDVDDDEVADEEADRLGLLVRSLAVIVSDG
jgi:hypothetical protein